MSEEIKIILDKKKVIEQIRNKIPKFYMVEVVYIFGSFVNSENFNDIDVALLISKELNPYERFKFAMKVARELERAMKPRIEFDVKILNYS
ncbi:MAG: nucleotidyltransferase domain-containing protein, partial [Candidatus Thermoplasmatota archaeon]|nr:nucleotidyltransferase domain-containing protein [Candidatus Thermoplasmatota archaeon]